MSDKNKKAADNMTDKDKDIIIDNDIQESEEQTDAEEAVADEESEPERGRKQDKSQKLKDKYQKQIDELQKSLNEANDKFKRLAAEYDNYRKRTQREKESIYSDAICDFAGEILPVIDNMDRAATVNPEESDSASIQSGIVLICKQMKDVLHKAGMTEIEALGKDFDPTIHNAIMHVDDESVGDNKIVEEFQKGYKINDKVIRHSMVKVAN